MKARRVACVGGATLDRTYRAPGPLRPGTSNPVVQARSNGGVARNVAESLARLGVPAALVSVVGADDAGRGLVDALARLGVDVSGVAMRDDAATAEYVAVLDGAGDLALGLADMGILDRLTPDAIGTALDGAGLVLADCNLPGATLAHLLARRRAGALPVLALDAVSVAKAARLPGDLAGLDLLFLNADEARALAGDLDPREAAAALRARGAGAVVLTRGAAGIVVADRDGIDALPAVPVAAIADVTGAGDALIAGTLGGIAAGKSLRDALGWGFAAAALALERPGGVRPDLSPALLADTLARARGRQIV